MAIQKQKTSEKVVKPIQKKKVVKKGAKLPNTREEKVVSSVISEKVVKPQRKATEKVKKIDDSTKKWESEKIVQKPARRTKKETTAEKMARELIEKSERSERMRKQNEERERILRDNLLLDIQEVAEKIVQKKGWQKVKIERAAYAVYLAHPEASKITLEQLGERFGFHRNSTIHWRYREDVIKIRDFLIYDLARHYTPAVIQNLAKSASMRNPFTWLAQEWLVKLYLQVIEKWSEKTEVEHSGSVDHDIFTMDLPPSQFVKRDKLPKKPWEDDDEDDEDPSMEESPEDLDEVESL